MDIALAIISVGLLIFLAHLFEALFDRTRVPDVLPLIFIGLVLGPFLHIVPQEAFGKLGNVFTTIALIVILFQSGLGLNYTQLREALVRGVRLTLINFLFSFITVGLVSVRLLDLSAMEGFILAAILGGTSSGVVIPLVQWAFDQMVVLARKQRGVQ